MIKLTRQQLLQKIKSNKWDFRVTRPGFLQSKGIVNEAEVQILKLTKNVSLTYDMVCWVRDLNLYDDNRTNDIISRLPKAFEDDKFWPRKIIIDLDKSSLKIDFFINKIKTSKLNSMDSKSKQKLLLQYVELLRSVQIYYIVAVPLTNYCENVLKKTHKDYLKYAVPIKQLDISRFSLSKNPMIEFAWVKTAYNVVGKLQKSELSSLKEEAAKEQAHDFSEKDHHIEGMQSGIYIRNRIKELSQKIWYYFDPVGESIADDIGISREEFFLLTYHEAIATLKNGLSTKLKKEINSRKKCFFIAIFDGIEYILSGDDAIEVVNFFAKKTDQNQVKGNVACKGLVTGTAKIVLSISQSGKFKSGDILITTMTTPDFVVLMNKAAAIVTDEGGLSCHAAIVSRELGIPCVIGTRIATKVFRDGEKIQVDAEKGIVKKI